ncbi:MAG TPA: VanZ family protein [Candidatus Acidoferrales bacterium]|nr:VanZ family protein [Candidatus Acidoferrales bacterium]
MIKSDDSLHRQSSAAWANRIVLLSLLGICYLTLFPFILRIAPGRFLHRSIFLLGSSNKETHSIDFILNVLLFVPYGFGLSAQARKRGAKKLTTFLIALGFGAATCYAVELLQLFIPSRDSGWDDVRSNTLGSVVGFFLFQCCGAPLLKTATKWEDRIEDWTSPKWIAWLLVFYLAAWFAISIPLQKETRLYDWDPQNVLVIGNDAAGQEAWRGKVSQLQLWSRALADKEMKAVSSGQAVDPASKGLLGSYDFSNPLPYQDATNSLPSLVWWQKTPHDVASSEINLDGKSWLTTGESVERFNRAVMKSSQFTIHIVCTPAEANNANGVIVSVSRPNDNVNVHLRQDGRSLALWFRDPLSARHANAPFYVPFTFDDNRTMNIAASYDGSDAFVYLNGSRHSRAYRLTPGATLAHVFGFVQTTALTGYSVVYETLIFFPAGMLVGLASRKWLPGSHPYFWMFSLGVILPAVLLELLLAIVGGGEIWFRDMAISIFLAVIGILLVNGDRRCSADIRATPREV